MKSHQRIIIIIIICETVLETVAVLAMSTLGYATIVELALFESRCSRKPWHVQPMSLGGLM
jgi:hypothetical protein